MKGNTCTVSMPLPPHEFIQIGWELFCMAPLHTLQFPLHSIPVRFNMLGMHPSSGINKVKGMIYHLMTECWNPLYSTVCCPLIRMDGLGVVQCELI